MATKKLTNIQEATDFVRGCTFMQLAGVDFLKMGLSL